ncbi:MAG: 4Fe-4S dicluster domain-containing protein [Candidatus Binatia bacterium]
MEPRGILFTPKRQQAIKQSPFTEKRRADEKKAQRHPETRRFMFLRADHERRNLYDGPVNPERLETKDWVGVTRYVRETAVKMGADLVGIAPLDEFDYVRGSNPPQGHICGIAFAIHMDFKEMKRLGPLAQTEVHRVYYRLSDLSVRLAQFIRSFGYHAVGHPNEGDILFIPIAWKAGLGELGRHGSLITKEFGPSVRLGVVTTEMPLVTEPAPVDYGFDDLCLRCNVCTNFCPGNAIVPKKKEIFGIVRWHVDTPACRPFFEDYEGCKVCLTVCPINAQTESSRLYKNLMKGLMRRKIPIRRLIDEWRVEGYREAEAFGEGWGDPAGEGQTGGID